MTSCCGMPLDWEDFKGSGLRGAARCWVMAHPVYGALTPTHPQSRDRRGHHPLTHPGGHPPNYRPQLSHYYEHGQNIPEPLGAHCFMGDGC